MKSVNGWWVVLSAGVSAVACGSAQGDVERSGVECCAAAGAPGAGAENDAGEPSWKAGGGAGGDAGAAGCVDCSAGEGGQEANGSSGTPQAGSGGSDVGAAGTSGTDGDRPTGPGVDNEVCDGGRPAWDHRDEAADVLVYGCTSIGIVAAVAATRLGQRALLVCPERRLGGMTGGGLGRIDRGRPEAIGGLSRTFFRQIKAHYDSPAAWTREAPEDFGEYDRDAEFVWRLEPHVARDLWENWVTDCNIPVERGRYLDREHGVAKDGARIRSVTMLDGETFAAKTFIDATYEGDLMAAAGVSYTVGREANAQYGETLNGVQVARTTAEQFAPEISPFVIPEDPSSGLLPRISAELPGPDGSADTRVMAYNYRLCMTTDPDNLVPFQAPAAYDPAQYELLLRTLLTGSRHVLRQLAPVPNLKTDTNSNGPFGTDNVGMSHAYADASYAERAAIAAEHRSYQVGYFYFLANDPRVPEDVRAEIGRYGLARDEFEESEHFPSQLYVREARRMIGDYVVTEADVRRRRAVADPIGMGSYTIDSHNTQRYATIDEDGTGRVLNEGNLQVRLDGPYPISYGALLPKREEAENLLVPFASSSTHVAFGSLRVEPTLMVMGQAAGTAAALASEGGTAVQDVPYAALRAQLLADRQVLPEMGESIDSAAVEGIVVDDASATFEGSWSTSNAEGPYLDHGYRHDGDSNKGAKRARFDAELVPGRYQVSVSYTHHRNRAASVPVVVTHAAGAHTIVVDQTLAPEDPPWIALGSYEFTTLGSVEVSNVGTTGYVVVDGVRFVAVP